MLIRTLCSSLMRLRVDLVLGLWFNRSCRGGIHCWFFFSPNRFMIQSHFNGIQYHCETMKLKSVRAQMKNEITFQFPPRIEDIEMQISMQFPLSLHQKLNLKSRMSTTQKNCIIDFYYKITLKLRQCFLSEIRFANNLFHERKFSFLLISLHWIFFSNFFAAAPSHEYLF